MSDQKCEVDGKPVVMAIFKNSGVCSENCRKIRDGEINPKCTYETHYLDEVGDVEVCIVHGQNSKYSAEEGEHRPCIWVDPWDTPEPTPVEVAETNFTDKPKRTKKTKKPNLNKIFEICERSHEGSLVEDFGFRHWGPDIQRFCFQIQSQPGTFIYDPNAVITPITEETHTH